MRRHRWRTHTHSRLTALCPGLPGWAGARKVKSIWILLKQETESGSGISWAICKSAPRSRQTTTPAPHHSVFSGQMLFLPPIQQRQSTEGNKSYKKTTLTCTNISPASITELQHQWETGQCTQLQHNAMRNLQNDENTVVTVTCVFANQ